MMTTERLVIEAKEAATLLKVSLSMIYKLLEKGGLEGYSVGRRKLIYADSLDSLRRRNALGRPAPARTEPTPAKPNRNAPVKPLELPQRRHLR